MMDILEFLSPVSVPAPLDIPFKGKSLYTQILVNRSGQGFDWSEIKVAILGVEEERNRVGQPGLASAPDEIRKQLYTLYAPDFPVSIADLGNIKQGATVEDTYFALRTVCSELMKKNVFPIVLGGSQDLTLPMFRAYEQLEQTVNLVTIDSHLDFGESDTIKSDNYLNSIVLLSPNYLFNYCNIGDQRYLNPPELYRMLNELHFENLRLGELNDSILSAEPHIRNADIVSLDMASVRIADAPGTGCSGPNGLYAEQACTLAYYAGFSDKLTSFGLFGVNPTMDQRNQTAELAAQIIWCLLDGISKRKGDYPIGTIDDYHKYIVHFEKEDHEIVFYKSPKSDRWWMEVPYPAGMQNKYLRHYLVPCTYAVYQSAANDEIPDLWWMTYRKLA